MCWLTRTGGSSVIRTTELTWPPARIAGVTGLSSPSLSCQMAQRFRCILGAAASRSRTRMLP